MTEHSAARVFRVNGYVFFIVAAQIPTFGVCNDKYVVSASDELAKIIIAPKARNYFELVDSSSKASRMYSDRFSNASDRVLGDLKDSRSVSVAIQASWEILRRSSDQSDNVGRNEPKVLGAKQTAQFLCFLEDATKTKTPRWWSQCLSSCRVWVGRHHYFEVPVMNDQAIKPFFGVVNAHIRVGTGIIRFRKERNPFFLPNDLENVRTGIQVGKVAVLADSSSVTGSPFKLYCYDTQTGRRVWSHDVWATERGSVSNPVHHAVEIVVNEKCVVIYGCATYGIYAEGFDRECGDVVFRFCSSYWNDFAEAWHRDAHKK